MPLISTTLFFLFIQAATNAARATAAMPEKQPALLSLIYMGGLAVLVLFLLVSLVRNRLRRPALATVASDLPAEVRGRLGATSTNRGLRALRWLFVFLALAVFGFHVYWARYAEQSNDRFEELNYKDLRNRRLSESTLRGWILDRKGTLDKAFALYQFEGNQITREYPVDETMSHLLGSDRGDPGLERALFGVQSGNVPESLQVVMGENIQQRANTDVRLTIDRDLQQAVAEQLKGKHGAVVMLNPQTGEVLAMYSNPSYSLKQAQDQATWIRLEADKRDNPLVNRALGTYYIPGSTFKTVTMTAAFLAGMQNEVFNGTPGGYVAAPGANPITDDNGSCEICGPMKIERAFEISSNQYFAQMGVKLGPERLANAARLLGIGIYTTPAEALRGRRQPEIWNASTDAIKRALAPRESTMVASPKMSRFDLALEGYGQGYAGQMTPLQMALAASAVANMDGRLMKLMIEYGRTPEIFNQVMPPQIAARERAIMGLVTGGTSGTARGVFAPILAQGITSGGKTGTAQKVVPVYDPKTGEPKTRKRVEKDRKGNVIREYEEVVMDNDNPRIDSWFLCFAPLERPQVAMAVIVEGGGYGSKTAAPIAAALVLKAKQLGLLGNAPGNQAPPLPQQSPPANRGKARVPQQTAQTIVR
ncbi:MAG: penicillin-binding transpeptidase domain-containing protein [Pyrinomonadaceae bacterium]